MSLERSEGPRAISTVDVLDRVLDKGLSIAGDIRISIAEIELLTMRIRMIMCSIAKAQEIGLDWWKYDRHLFPITPRDEMESGFDPLGRRSTIVGVPPSAVAN